jgi:hypothetical protein
MEKLTAAILGAGPSAAYALAACRSYGIEAEIITNRAPSVMFPGPFWLRLNPTEAPIPKQSMHIFSEGTSEIYLQKQWKDVDLSAISTSFPTQARTELIYEPALVLTEIWKRSSVLMCSDISDFDIGEIAKDREVVFVTFPTAKSRNALQKYSVKYPIVSYKVEDNPTLNYCIYVGTEESSFVRTSRLFGRVHLEYPSDHIINQDILGDGILCYAPDTRPDTPEWDPTDVPAKNVHLIGRHAEWNRKILSHDAYSKVLKILEEVL